MPREARAWITSSKNGLITRLRNIIYDLDGNETIMCALLTRVPLTSEALSGTSMHFVLTHESAPRTVVRRAFCVFSRWLARGRFPVGVAFQRSRRCARRLVGRREDPLSQSKISIICRPVLASHPRDPKRVWRAARGAFTGILETSIGNDTEMAHSHAISILGDIENGGVFSAMIHPEHYFNDCSQSFDNFNGMLIYRLGSPFVFFFCVSITTERCFTKRKNFFISAIASHFFFLLFRIEEGRKVSLFHL